MTDWETVKAALPVTELEEDKEKRKKLWKSFQVSEPRYLALFELYNGIQNVLKCEELFDAKPAIVRAHRYARVVNPKGPKDELEFCEFRLLLIYLKGLFNVYQLFMSIDESKDKVLSLEELRHARPRLQAAGIQVLDVDSLWRQLKGSNE